MWPGVVVVGRERSSCCCRSASTGFDSDVVEALTFYAADKTGRNLWAAALAWSRHHAEIQAELDKRKN
jgi:hypothetical protein